MASAETHTLPIILSIVLSVVLVPNRSNWSQNEVYHIIDGHPAQSRNQGPMLNPASILQDACWVKAL